MITMITLWGIIMITILQDTRKKDPRRQNYRIIWCTDRRWRRRSRSAAGAAKLASATASLSSCSFFSLLSSESSFISSSAVSSPTETSHWLTRNKMTFHRWKEIEIWKKKYRENLICQQRLILSAYTTFLLRNLIFQIRRSNTSRSSRNLPRNSSSFSPSSSSDGSLSTKPKDKDEGKRGFYFPLR